MRAGNRYRRLFGWWYLSIGAGFLLLAANRFVLGDGMPAVVLRGLIAVGFFVLAYLELKGRLST